MRSPPIWHLEQVWRKARVGYTFVQRTKEFVGQSGSDRFGQLALSFPF